MKIFALGDPHLSFDQNGNEYKPMNIFGPHWENHSEQIKKNWINTVKDQDVVLIPGDISWALKLEEVHQDLAFLDQLPGQKIIIKGNHELWWETISKVRKILPDSIEAIQNDHILLPGGLAICGTRGWMCPEGNENATAHDEKIFARELVRLKMSLDSVPKDAKEIIVMLHYPPTNSKHEASAFIELLQQYRVSHCIYGHLHSYSISGKLPLEKWGIKFTLVSADAINFTPKFIQEIAGDLPSEV